MKMDHMTMDMDSDMQGMDGHDGMAMMHHQMPGMDDDPGMAHMGNLSRKFWISLILTIPILLLEPIMGINFHLGVLSLPLRFPGSDYLALIIAAILYFYGGMPFLRGGIDELRARRPGMMALIALGITVAFGYSVYAVLAGTFGNSSPMNFFMELATLIDVMLLGHWLEMNAVMRAGDARSALQDLLPHTAHVLQDGEVHDVDQHSLQVGMVVRVLAGEAVPADGRIENGTSQINEALLTGESKPVSKKVGKTVIGGTTNGDGVLDVQLTAVGDDTFLGQIATLTAAAQGSKSHAENMAGRVASWLFYIALLVAIIAFAIWTPVSGVGAAMMIAVTVLVIACPHALGLALPLVLARATAFAANDGLLLRNRDAFERSRQARYVLLDKTGTITQGQFNLNQVVVTPGNDADEVLTVAASLEQQSNHPLAAGILRAAKQRQLPLLPLKHVNAIAGVGMRGENNGQQLAIVNAAYLDQKKIAYNQAEYERAARAGNTVSFVLRDDQVLGMLAVGDQVKTDAAAAIGGFISLGYTPVMLTGDNEFAARAVAGSVGITDVHAALMPADKVKLVQQYQEQGGVIMVGDGINDAPSLAQADVGFAIGSGTNVAIESADVIVVKSQLTDVLAFLKLARRTSRKMVQNLWWASAYNIIAIPLAAGVLAPIGITLAPAVGGLIMAASAIIVALNALSLRAE
ncbi:copper-translocating P-type ATPase [Lacticaseibacillus zhaodongensis]|uniref:copper-translocating P-type ATPase n=1 Tax=Lacticaseibacillus zhaodongensis TaxID=2668065 RepID=UPI0012D2C82D|nr:copper-translocating P-type ATPase [Lacticaseibacillus zhaodongensis]